MKEILGRKLPPSAYEVIHLPTFTPNVTPKRSCHQQQGPKRQKVSKSSSSEAEEFPSKLDPKYPSFSEVLRKKVKKSLSSEAEEFCSKLDPKYPSFSKALAKSHVAPPFWMMLPPPFCKRHLPPKDTEIILEYQNGKQYNTKYLAARTTLSGGWRKFSMDENLVEGVELVFQLVGPNKFKVYRISSVTAEDNVAHVQQNLAPKLNRSDLHTKDAVNIEVRTAEQKVGPHLPSPPGPISEDDDHGMLSSEDADGITQQMKFVERNSPVINSGNSSCFQFPQDNVDCADFTSFEGFLIEISELLKNSCELPWEIKRSYYQLCSSQNEMLHTDIVKGSSPDILAGSIIETVNIANALKSCELSTYGDKFEIWDQKLKSLGGLGMNVGFLCAHLHRLQRMAYEAAKYKQQYSDLCSQQADSESMIKTLQDELSELMGASEKRADDIEKLKSEIVKRELRLQEQVSAPW